ncbi:unnamed protein product, partial [Amoebophrya sp. A25]
KSLAERYSVDDLDTPGRRGGQRHHHSLPVGSGVLSGSSEHEIVETVSYNVFALVLSATFLPDA